MSGTINSVFALLLCFVHHSYQCSPGPDYKPPTIAELTQKAPIVVRGFVVNKGEDINLYKACLYISHVYKGVGVKSYICVSGFGSTAACLSDPSYGREYLFFLNRKRNRKLGTGYAARYDSIHSATQVFEKNSEDGIRDGKCCPHTLKSIDCHIGEDIALSNAAVFESRDTDHFIEKYDAPGTVGYIKSSSLPYEARSWF